MQFHGGDAMRAKKNGLIRLFGLCLALFLTCGACVRPLAAAEYTDGEVLFAARYEDYTSLRDTGLRFGTASWAGAGADLSDESLCIRSASDRKTYLLLPADIPSTDTYTIIYEFRFAEIAEMGGYCGFILTCSGDAPSNRTELLLRASGACDGAGQFGEAISSALAAGDPVQVTIPIRHGMMSEIRVRAGDVEETLTMENVRTVADGRRGFVLRNASVDLREVKIVSGVDYEAESGYYAEHSYIVPQPEDPGLVSPPTGDGVWCAFLLVGGACVAVCLLARRRRNA